VDEVGAPITDGHLPDRGHHGSHLSLSLCLAYAEDLVILHMPTICRSEIMRTVSIFKNGKNQAIRLPTDMAYEGVGELEITRDGDTITLRPARPSWLSLAEQPKADADFLEERPNVISDEGRFNL
jgi:antitoxin VapB